MKLASMIAIVLALGCSKEKESPKAAPKPADAATATAPPADAAPAPAETSATRIVVEPKRLTVRGGGKEHLVPDVNADVDGTGLEKALTDAGVDGGVVLEISGDLQYQRVITVMDHATKLTKDVSIDTPGEDAAPPVSRAPTELSRAPLVIITKTEVSLGVGAPPEKLGTLDDAIPALKVRLGNLDPKPTQIIIQAEKTTPAAFVVEVVETARAAGIGDVLFAVKSL